MSFKKFWKPPTSKEMKLTDEDSLITQQVISWVKKFYENEQRYVLVDKNHEPKGLFDKNFPLDIDFRIQEPGPDMKEVLIDVSYHQYQCREKDPRYYSESAPLQIHCFGDSWTYGWDVKQREAFPHLLGDNHTSVFNHGAGRAGVDYCAKKVAEVYEKYNHRENPNFVYVITIPHTYRRMSFNSNGLARRTWQKPTAANVNPYNHYLYFYHHYQMLNRLIGRDRIIWGTWDEEVPKEMIDIFFELHDRAGTHPGIESHKKYAEQIKTILRKSGWYQ